MFAYRTPGVYFEDADNRTASLGLVRTDIAGLVGIARRGPIHRPVRVQSWTQFVSFFGLHMPAAYLAYSVEGFFSNGGDTCWVVRVADPELAQPSRAILYDSIGRPAVALSAACRIDNSGPFRSVQPSTDPANDIEPDPGVWGDAIAVTVRSSGGGRFTLTITCPGEPTEVYRDVVLDPADDRDIVKILNAVPPIPVSVRSSSSRPRASRSPQPGSRLVMANDLRSPAFDPAREKLVEALTLLSGGCDGLAPSHVLADARGAGCLRLIATPAGASGRTIRVKVDNGADASHFKLTLADPADTVNPPETWDALSLDPVDPGYVVTVLNDRWKGASSGSRLVRARDLTPPDPVSLQSGVPFPFAVGDIRVRPGPPVAGSFDLAGGLNPTHLSGVGAPPGQQFGLSTLEVIDEVSIVAMPDLAPPQPPPARIVKPSPPRCDRPRAAIVPPPRVPEVEPETAPFFSDSQVTALYDALMLHAALLRDRVVLIDPPALVAGVAAPSRTTATAPLDDGQEAQRVLAWLETQPIDSSYAALYYPWLLVDDPLALSGSVRPVPPCGHVAGVFARTDRDFGVHKPPANTEVEGARDLTDQVGDLAHGDLNERGVNVIRAYPGRGIRVYGARTLSSDVQWQFLNVRRLLLMIETAIDRGTQWVVFEPHNTALQDDLDRVIRSFLNDLWQRGMLDGATPADAFTVQCDDTTNPPEEIDAGRLICLVGVQPPPPAEFVIIRVGKTLEGTVILETA
jgi:phage tail sheath protein FI